MSLKNRAADRYGSCDRGIVRSDSDLIQIRFRSDDVWWSEREGTAPGGTEMSALRFDPLDPDFVADPYPTYHRLRAEDPVHRSAQGFWVLTRYDDVVSVLRDPCMGKEAIEALVAARYGAPAPAVGLSMLVRDPPDHTRLRGLVNKAFTPRVVEV